MEEVKQISGHQKSLVLFQVALAKYCDTDRGKGSEWSKKRGSYYKNGMLHTIITQKQIQKIKDKANKRKENNEAKKQENENINLSSKTT
jgi:hypothetical protein